MTIDVSARVAGAVTIGGVHVAYQVFGNGPRAVLLLPPWSICHPAIWRYQVPRLTTRYTVVAFDGRGNGSSDRPLDPANYTDDVSATDALAVLDAVGIDEAAVVSASGATRVGLALAARHPGRVPAAIFIDPSLPIAPPIPEFAEAVGVFDEPRVTYEGWFKFNRHYWQQDWPGFLEFFMGRCFTEPDSSVHGAADAVAPVGRGQELARLSQAELIVLPVSGHQPQYRDPELVNRPVLEFLDRHYPAASR